jgi:arginyl-tRNA synthetase
VVDADDIIEELKKVARLKTEELGKVKDFNPGELNELYNTIALGALKFFLLRVDPKKKMVFNPEESIDFHGFTGPFIQWTYARIRSIIRKVEEPDPASIEPATPLHKLEKDLIVFLEQFPALLSEAAKQHDPSLLAIYIFNLAKLFNSFYTVLSVMNAESEEKKKLRLRLSEMTAGTISTTLRLLGMNAPERM